MTVTLTVTYGCIGNVTRDHGRCATPQPGQSGRNRVGGKGKRAAQASLWLANRDASGRVRCATCPTMMVWGESENGHLVSDANGGAYCAENIVLQCMDCNRAYGDTNIPQCDVRPDIVLPPRWLGEGPGGRAHRALANSNGTATMVTR